MKIITLWQPWAMLIPLGMKKYETRSWSTKYRGTLLIHAAKRKIDIVAFHNACSLSDFKPPEGYRIAYGEVVAIAQLTDCIQMTEEFINQQTKLEIACGDWRTGQYAWKLEDICPVTDKAGCKGMQGLVDAPSEVIKRLAIA